MSSSQGYKAIFGIKAQALANRMGVLRSVSGGTSEYSVEYRKGDGHSMLIAQGLPVAVAVQVCDDMTVHINVGDAAKGVLQTSTYNNLNGTITVERYDLRDKSDASRLERQLYQDRDEVQRVWGQVDDLFLEAMALGLG